MKKKKAHCAKLLEVDMKKETERDKRELIHYKLQKKKKIVDYVQRFTFEKHFKDWEKKSQI